jgi:acetate kinase
MNILLLNSGSSSLKGTLMESDGGQPIARATADWAGSKTRYQYTGTDDQVRSEEVSWTGHAIAVQRFVVDLLQTEPIALRNRSALAAVGHRVVHGGQFTSSVRITLDARSRITGLADLAPLHNPPSLVTLAAAEKELPNVPHVAVFDTAFHATLPPEARTYPVPLTWTRDWGIPASASTDRVTPTAVGVPPRCSAGRWRNCDW